MYKKVLFTALLLITIPFLERFCHKQTDGFMVSKIRKAPKMASSPTTTYDEVLSILSLPLTYIGRGGQCFAFATADDRYVVKLLKYNNNYPRFWLNYIPFPFGFETYRQNTLERKRKKIAGEYASYKIAFEKFPEETGVLYIHFENQENLHIPLKIRDKLNIIHEIPADAYQFYIQKKGTPFYPQLQQMISSGDLSAAKKALDELLSFLFKRCEQKITDKDDGIWRNFAFQDGHPFQIDIGQLIYNPSLVSPEDYKKDLLFFTKDFHRWLEEQSPPLAQYLKERILTYP